jgi:hypothetical protein
VPAILLVFYDFIRPECKGELENTSEETVNEKTFAIDDLKSRKCLRYPMQIYVQIKWHGNSNKKGEEKQKPHSFSVA